MNALRLGLSANAGGAHTAELLEAVREAQRWLGVRADVVWADDRREPGTARLAALSLCEAGVPIVVGHLSAAAALAAVPVYESRDVAFIAPATSHLALNVSMSDGILRAFGTDEKTASAMVADHEPGDGAMVIVERQAYSEALGHELARELANLGCSVEWVILPEQHSRLPASAGLGCVYISGIHEFCAPVLRQLRQLGYRGEVVLGDDCLTPSFVVLAAGAAEGCRVIGHVLPIRKPEHGLAVPDTAAGNGYYRTCMVAAIVALSSQTIFPAARGAELGRLIRSEPWPTPFGAMTFDTSGNLDGTACLSFTVRGGAFVSDG